MKTIAGYLVLLLIVAFIILPLASLFFASDILGSQTGQTTSSFNLWQDAYLRQVIYFSLWQATLSTDSVLVLAYLWLEPLRILGTSLFVP